ncbi:hypothetical protein C7M84_005483 [Penaeus vannamei]|uniref:Uncharacterized protein n=1 Tax=Penaeus vannamei TaxID=6689 RepID=A0A3R7P5F9_PENVA|nr:hypothetical protein C7M84_005483 [Penaeus vannamei]
MVSISTPTTAVLAVLPDVHVDHHVRPDIPHHDVAALQDVHHVNNKCPDYHDATANHHNTDDDVYNIDHIFANIHIHNHFLSNVFLDNHVHHLLLHHNTSPNHLHLDHPPYPTSSSTTTRIPTTRYYRRSTTTRTTTARPPSSTTRPSRSTTRLAASSSTTARVPTSRPTATPSPTRPSVAPTARKGETPKPAPVVIKLPFFPQFLTQTRSN